MKLFSIGEYIITKLTIACIKKGSKVKDFLPHSNPDEHDHSLNQGELANWKKATFFRHKLWQTSLALMTLAGLGLMECRPTKANTISYTITDLGALNDTQSQANSINDIGQVVGISGSSIFTATGQAVFWSRRNDHPLALGMLPGDSESIAYKINNLSQTVGFSGTDTAHGQAVLWLHGQPVNLGRLPNDSASIALGINDRSQVVGFSGSDIFAAAPRRGSFMAG